MNVKEFIKSELSGWGRFERVIFPLEILLIIAISFYIGDNKVALISAICGISYTILAGKGKISCYFFGLCGTLCYAFISYKNALYGNLALYMLYYFPMQIFGIFKWKQHLKKDSNEIVKTKLNTKERFAYFGSAMVVSAITAYFLQKSGGAAPFMDAITTVFSIVGLILTIRRCIEQWHLWFVVNLLSAVMWIEAYMNGSNCFATIIMWVTYIFLSVYFLHNWKKEIKTDV